MSRANPPQSPHRRTLLLGGLAYALSGCSQQDAPEAPKPATGHTAFVPEMRAKVADNDPDFVLHAEILPGVIDSSTQGPFIDLIRAIDESYPAGMFKIEAFPIARVGDNLSRRQCDIAFPELRVGSDATLPHRFSTESVGTVSFVLYVNRDKPLTPEMIRQAVADQTFAFQIEAPPVNWGFPILTFHTLESALKKVSAGRIGALLWAQEETDTALHKLNLKNIRRIHFGDYEDVFMLNRDARGDFADQVLTQAIRSLRASGRLREIYRTIHRPYEDWQP